MKLRSVEKTETNTAVMVIEVSPEEFEEGLNQAYRKGRHEITVPGFRKGKAPRKVIEATFGPTVFYEDAINYTYPKAYAEAVVEAKVDPVDQPEVSLEEFPEAGGYVFKATVTLYPEVTLGQYKGLTAERDEPVITDEEVEKAVEGLRQRNARLESVDRPVANGDIAVIDFEGFVDGTAFDGGKAEKYSLEIGSGNFIPGFEEQLVGMKAGEDRDITVTFPEGYSPELGGKEAVFKIKLHEVKEKQLPELDDEFAKDVSEFDTLDEVKANLREKMLEGAEAGADQAYAEALINQVLDNSTVEIPAVLIENQIGMMIQEQEMMMQQQGLTMEKYLELTGSTMDAVRDSARPTAERMVKLELVLNKIAEEENLEVSDEDIEKEYQAFSEMYKVDLETVKKSVSADDLKPTLMRRKAEELIKANATASAVTAKPAKKAPAKKSTKKAETAEAEEKDAETPAETEKKPAARKAPAKKKADDGNREEAEAPAAEEK